MDFETFFRIASDPVSAIGFLRHFGVFPEEKFCERCSSKMAEHQRPDISDKDSKLRLTRFLWEVRMWAYHQIGIGQFLSLSKTTSVKKTKLIREDPITGAHTNNVEGYCASVKKAFIRAVQTNEKIWREQYGKTPEETFEIIMSKMAEYNDLNE
ncbi:hypothetical protein RF11_07723 [Thelohanellus kitauei]|uniref:Uncharacterized protein n=1 Tax=Thelohanellus kitauei TaxID=669202 RepID=A0A0C2MSV5_THEKT|nr:hypothetical protein RF11_07723 [Thelohanellus kitauei]